MAEQNAINQRLNPREGRRLTINRPKSGFGRTWMIVYLVLLVVGFYLMQLPPRMFKRSLIVIFSIASTKTK